jgi:arylsulfatase
MGVLPMDDRNAERIAMNTSRGRTRFVFLPGMARIDRLSAPDVYDRSFTMTAQLVLDRESASGVLIAAGTSLAGYEWLLIGGRPVFAYVLSRTEMFVARARETLPPAAHTIGVHFERTGPASGVATLRVGDREVGAVAIPRQWRIHAVHAGVRCGVNTGAPVSRLYGGPLPFEGRLDRVVVQLL